MLLLLLALLQTSAASEGLATAPPEEAKATLQSCQMTDKGWVCHYQIPSTTIIRPLEAPDATPSVTSAPTLPMIPVPMEPVAPQVSAPPPAAAVDHTAEVSRQTRLIARCADAKWYSPCLPGERTEAKLLREASQNAATLRGKVTTLLSEQRCDEAIKTALEGGDLPLAREAREFCAPAH
ncbi:hypothetical protein [Caulobacter sp. RHG1]|uniref:hypothetical protein n=1 Tax=Caulobacter sp. (strain RHG1) TaxID=2545762 RepID=UPI0015543AA6|nr:hypothetical protein [Caulobacter sp. RHG1]NQE63118.1 hypothetical protein [Caulobacter sp. RHG1]